MLHCNCWCIDSTDSLSWVCSSLAAWQGQTPSSLTPGQQQLKSRNKKQLQNLFQSPALSSPGWGVWGKSSSCCHSAGRPAGLGLLPARAHNNIRTDTALLLLTPSLPNTEQYQVGRVGQLLCFNATHPHHLSIHKKEFAIDRAADLRAIMVFRVEIKHTECCLASALALGILSWQCEHWLNQYVERL